MSQVCVLSSSLSQYTFSETKDHIFCDALLLPQGNDQNYHLYYACIMINRPYLSIVSSSNPYAKKQEGTNRFILPSHQSNQKKDYVLLYVGYLCRLQRREVVSIESYANIRQTNLLHFLSHQILRILLVHNGIVSDGQVYRILRS